MEWPPELQAVAVAYGEALSAYLQPVCFQAGAQIYAAGEAGDNALIVDHGEVRLELDREELDSERVIATLGPKSILGELALLDGLPRSVSAFADSAVEGRLLTASNLQRMLELQPALAAQMYAALGRSAAAKLRDTNTRLSDVLVSSYGKPPYVDEMVAKARQAQPALKLLTEEAVDALLFDLCQPILREAESLAEAAVKETRLGNVADKTAKHRNICLGLYHHLAGQRGHGLLRFNRRKQVAELGEAMGVIFGLVPMTNPVSTAVFKAMIAVKSRNAVILSPNRIGAGVVIRTVDLMREVIGKHGLPQDILQVVRERNSRVTTQAFMRHAGINFILATGGASMVRAAYSSGTPAIGVGAGNTPCLIAGDANVHEAARAIVRSKSFDNGMICGSEHNLIVVAGLKDAFRAALTKAGAAVLNEPETKALLEYAAGQEGWSRKVIGKAAAEIAEKCGIARDYPIRLLVVPASGIAADNPLAREKMTTILSLFTVRDDAEGFEAAKQLLAIEGAGHTAVIHTQSREKAQAYAMTIPASRVLVNSPAMQGISGLCTGLEPSMTLGCGTFGGTSTTDNVSYRHLMNIKRLAWYRPGQKTEAMLGAAGRMGGGALLLLRGIGRTKAMLRRAA